MILIRCPFCGELRDEEELAYGGEAGIVRPVPEAGDAAWTEYLFMRANPKGSLLEQWCCAAGCGQWFLVRRDTVSHRITEVLTGNALSPMGEGGRP